jgi:hypothetical protein
MIKSDDFLSLPSNKCPSLLAYDMKGIIQPIFCGRWQCEYCEKVNAALWAMRTWHGIETMQQKAWFWTLTFPGSVYSPSFAYRILPKMWDTIRKYMQRQEHDSWLYVAFVQGQPRRSDMPHFHIISDRVPMHWKYYKDKPKAWLRWRFKDFAVHYGFGHQADCELVDSKKAALYVSRYASRGDKAMPKNFRRVRACEEWPKLPETTYAPYIVRRLDEPFSAYISRVSEVTHIERAILLDRWQNKTSEETDRTIDNEGKLAHILE